MSAGRLLFVPILILIAMDAASSPAVAHNLLLDSRIIDGRLRVEAFYADDSPAPMAKITVENELHQIVAEGTADERGTWQHPLPPGKYTVRAETVGHAAREVIIVREESLAEAERPVSREERTAIPWLRMIAGLVLISVLTSGFFWRRGSRRSKTIRE